MRIPTTNDPCFLVDKEAIWGDMLADILKQNNIPFFYKKLLGTGLAMKIGPALERYKFYVPFSRISEARDLVETLFTPIEEE